MPPTFSGLFIRQLLRYCYTNYANNPTRKLVVQTICQVKINAVSFHSWKTDPKFPNLEHPDRKCIEHTADIITQISRIYRNAKSIYHCKFVAGGPTA